MQFGKQKGATIFIPLHMQSAPNITPTEVTAQSTREKYQRVSPVGSIVDTEDLQGYFIAEKRIWAKIPQRHKMAILRANGFDYNYSIEKKFWKRIPDEWTDKMTVEECSEKEADIIEYSQATVYN